MMLDSYFPKSLAQLIEQGTTITPQIAFTSTEGFILNKDGFLLSSLGCSITKITQIDYTDNILTVLDTEGRCKRRFPPNLICLASVHTDVVQLVGRYFLLHDGTVVVNTPNGINVIKSVKNIVQIAPHYDRILTLNSNYEIGYIFKDVYIAKTLSSPVVKLHRSRIVELLDRSLIQLPYIVSLNATKSVEYIKSHEDIYLDTSHRLTAMTSYFNHLRKIKPELGTRSTLRISVLDFVRTDYFLVILHFNGDVIMLGQNNDELFGLPVDLSTPRLVIENKPTVLNMHKS